VRVAIEQGLSGAVGEVVTTRVPEPPVEDHGAARLDQDRHRIRRLAPAGQCVRAMTSGDDAERAVLRRRHVREEERHFHREARPRRLELHVLAPAVLVPPPPRLRLRLGRVDVEVAVIDVDVPSEQVGDERQANGVVDELEERIVARQETEDVQRAFRPSLLRPHPVDGSLQPWQLRSERLRNDHEPVALELLLHRPLYVKDAA
jgi:hypothetical protein